MNGSDQENAEQETAEQTRQRAINANSPMQVAREVERILAAKGSHDLPPIVPKTLSAASHWFMNVLFDPFCMEDDKVVGLQFSTPYRDRVMYLMRRFFSFSMDDRDAIAEMANDGVHWRGDDLEFFNSVYINTKAGPKRTRGARE